MPANIDPLYHHEDLPQRMSLGRKVLDATLTVIGFSAGASFAVFIALYLFSAVVLFIEGGR